MRRIGRMGKGFTLIELILVIVIIGILAAIIVPRFVSQLGKAKESNARANLNSLRTTLATFMANGGAWPADEAGLVTALTSGDSGMRAIPENPLIADAAIRAKFKVTSSATLTPAATDFDELVGGWIYHKKLEGTTIKQGEVYINSKDTAQQKW